MRFWFKFIYAIFLPVQRILVPLRVKGKENIPKGPAIVCANHTSSLDPILIAYAFGINCRLNFMAKAELFSIPILKSILSALCVFPVSRGEPDISSIRTTMKYLKSGDMVMMFPEGTRVSPEESVEAKTGAIRIAAKTKVPILPIHLTPGRKIFHLTRLVIGIPYMVEIPPDKNYEMLVGKLMDSIFELEPKG